MSHFGNIERAENIFQEKLGEIEREYPDLPEEEQEEKAAKRTQEQLESDDYFDGIPDARERNPSLR